MNKKLNRRPMKGYDISESYDVICIPKAIKFSLNQLNLANERKRKAGYRSFSSFGRDCILNTQIVERVTKEQMQLFNELIRERNNLNQIAKACNAGRCWSVANESLSVIRKRDGIIDLFNRNKTSTMFAKIRKGDTFGSCLDYITRVKQDRLPSEKREWRMLGSDGVRLNTDEKGWRKKASQDIERPTLMRNKIKDPCGHISLGFSSKDQDRLTDDYMLKMAEEYMTGMGIENTPYVVVRHLDKEHPHCHIMFSRVDYDGKIIKSVTNYNRNRNVCLDITERNGLTMGEDSLNLDTSKLRGAEKSNIEIRQTAHRVLQDRSVMDWASFQRKMNESGISVTPLRNENGNIKTLIYKKGRHSFVSSKIGKQFTPTALVREFNTRQEANERERLSSIVDPNNRWIHLDGSPVPPTEYNGTAITPEQQQLYLRGFTIRVADVYIRFNPETKTPDVSKYNHDILSGGGMPFVPGAHPEYADFFAGLSGFDKEQFKRFRRRHPTLTNQEAMSMFKMNEGQSQRIGTCL